MRNWVPTWLLVAPSARRRPISPRRSSTEMTMTLATPNPADQQRNRAEAEHQAAKGAGGRRSRDEHIGRPADLDGVRLSGVGGRGQHPLHRGRLAWVGAQVNPGVTAGVAEHRGADREAHDTELSISGARGTDRRIPTTAK